jgi:hypothetical protein
LGLLGRRSREAQAAVADKRSGITLPAPQQGAHASQQLDEGEGLGQVVVSTEFQAFHSIIDGVARAQDKDRGARLAIADLFKDKFPWQSLRSVGEELPSANFVRRGKDGFGIVLRQTTDGRLTSPAREPVPGDWEILSNSHKYTKADAHTLEFDVPVPKNGEVKVTYRVRVKM